MKPKIQLLGIVNLTDDSYYAASRAQDPDAFLARVGTMLAEGADWIDIGACSTRPGAQPVGADEEWRRLDPPAGVSGRARFHRHILVVRRGTGVRPHRPVPGQ